MWIHPSTVFGGILWWRWWPFLAQILIQIILGPMAGYSRNLFHCPIREDWARRILGTQGSNSPSPLCVTCWDMVAYSFPAQPLLPLHISSIPSPQIRNLPWSFLKAQPIANCVTPRILLSWDASLQGFVLLLVFVSNFVSWIGFLRGGDWDKDSNVWDLLGVKEAEWGREHCRATVWL